MVFHLHQPAKGNKEEPRIFNSEKAKSCILQKNKDIKTIIV